MSVCCLSFKSAHFLPGSSGALTFSKKNHQTGAVTHAAQRRRPVRAYLCMRCHPVMYDHMQVCTCAGLRQDAINHPS